MPEWLHLFVNYVIIGASVLHCDWRTTNSTNKDLRFYCLPGHPGSLFDLSTTIVESVDQPTPDNGPSWSFPASTDLFIFTIILSSSTSRK